MRFRSWADRRFPRDSVPAQPGDGLDGGPGPDQGAWAAALLIALAFIGTIEALVLSAPVPPGGDPGQWITNTFPYIGKSYPDQIIPFGYPPALFPLLGGLYVAGGGAIHAAQIYVALAGLLLGLSTFVLARALLINRMSALFVEAFVLIDAPLLRLFFFGAYPTLLGIVFFNLTIAFGARYVRSHEPWHLFLFWVAFAAAVLTHSLVGVILAGTVLVAGISFAAMRRVPRGVFNSWGGRWGATIFAASVGSYYLATSLAGIRHPDYLQVNAFSLQKGSISQLLFPFQLHSFPGLVGRTVANDPTSALATAVVLLAVMAIALGTLVRLRPRAILIPGVVVSAWIITVLGLGLAAWELSIVTDFRRFAYFLYIPIVLIGGTAIDVFLDQWYRGGLRGPVPANPVPVTRRSPTPRSARDFTLVGGSWGALPAIVGVFGIVTILAVAGFSTLPTLQGYEHQFTGESHSSSYLSAIASIKNSGIPGSVVTTSVPADRWTRALTDRDTYAPAVPTSYVFYGRQIIDDELAYFALNSRIAVTNGLTYASLTGTTPSFFNDSPTFGAFNYGQASPILRVVPQSLHVQVAGGRLVPVFPHGAPPPTITFPGADGAQMEIAYNVPTSNVTVAVLVHALPGTNEVQLTISATSTGVPGVVVLSASLQAPPAKGGNVTTAFSAPGSFQWQPAAMGGVLVTVGQVSPLGALIGAGSTNATGGRGANVALSAHAPGSAGVPVLSLQVNLTTPAATNLVALPPLLSSGDILTGWSARFVLIEDLPGRIGALLPAYLTSEYGAAPFSVNGKWIVLLLPEVIPTLHHP